MGTRVRSPSTTKARGPGETTRCHGPRHVRARASDEARGSAPGDGLGAGRGLAQGESRLPRGRSAPGSVTGQSGWKSGSRACAGAPAPVPGEDHSDMRLPRRVRRRADQRGREEGRCDAAHACAEVRPARYLGTTDIAHGSRARCASVSTHTAPSPSGPSRICGGRPKRFTSCMRFGPCPLPRGAPGVVRVVVPVVEGDHSCPVELRARPWGRRREERHTGVWPTSYRPDRFAGVSQVVRG